MPLQEFSKSVQAPRRMTYNPHRHPLTKLLKRYIVEGKGHHGQSYAIPTLDSKLGKITRTELKKNIAEFVSYVLMNQNLTFYLTKIGCGIAGWDIEDVKELFWQVIEEERTEEASEQFLPANLIIPQEFMP